ncbi:calpain, invertebrate [Mytilus galloprovincialis]|uniref:Calpain, invertebrate n=1 Tax=Mytilus galloprovincialis TaxID=29158 RepID=A0A8B6EJ82_MYTGA|nr:calpain, invertebrate [Mytilus galloprovincialis]
MGCAASSDGGTQYASLGQHGQQNVRSEPHIRSQQPTPSQQNTQHQSPPPKQNTQEQPPPPQQNAQEQQQPSSNEAPPPYEHKSGPVPIVAAKPKSADKNGPVGVKSSDAKSGVDLYNTEDMMLPGLPDFTIAEYVPTDIGTHELFLDFRTSSADFPTQEPPNPDGDLYTDYEFTVDVAFPKRSDLEWKRPMDVAEEPVLFSEGTTRFDIGQGEVGTCWFLAMVANIADKPRLLRRVIPGDAYKIGSDDYDGIFHSRFWRFGAWNDTYIDDFLPIVYETNIAGAHSATDPNEMWVALLEKAFAKLYGSYEEITAGLTADSFMNLTGGVAEMIDFRKKRISSERLFQRLHNAFQCPTTMVGCAVPGKNDGKCGLVGGHAYSMNGAFVVGGAKLLRIRNPWGNGEWNGPWSDGSPEWDSAPSDCVPPPSKDDGEFYMDINDFLGYFEDCTICNLTPDFDRDGNPNMLNYVTCIYGDWRDGKNGGFEQRTKNPCYSVTLGDEAMDDEGKVALVVQIVQRTLESRDDVADVRCDIFKVLSRNGHCVSLELLGDKSNLYMGNVQNTYRFLVEPGSYVAIPSTLEAGYEKEFLIRFFTAGPLSNPHEVDNITIMTGRGRNGDDPAENSRLKCTKCSVGAFQSGVNAGGQIACEGFANNPQYLLTVNDEQTLRVEVMQPEKDDGFALGIKLFEAPGDIFPADYDWLNDNYGNAVRDSEGGDGPFQFGTSVDTCYTVYPGTYLLLIHCDSEADENDFSVAIFSECPIEMESAHV